MNILGKLGDPEQVAAALKPLIDGAEDKALAELHASAVLAVTALHMAVDNLTKMLEAQSQDWQGKVAQIADALGVAVMEKLQDIADQYHPTITFGVQAVDVPTITQTVPPDITLPVCAECKRPVGAQHKPSCHRQGVVSTDSVEVKG